MTKEEFEKGYADRSGITLEELHKFGLHGVLCDCGEKGCHGWAMIYNSEDEFDEMKSRNRSSVNG